MTPADQMASICLTYSEGNLPEHQSLQRRDAQLFLMRLRTNLKRKFDWKTPIRYYGCGEYSPAPNLRPHYHLALFNVPLFLDVDRSRQPQTDEETEIRGISKSRTSEPMFDNFNRLCLDAWDYKGIVHVQDFSHGTVNYLVDYFCKGKIGTKNRGRSLETAPEFIMASRRPGIGVPYVETYAKTLKQSGLIDLDKRLPDLENGHTYTKLPYAIRITNRTAIHRQNPLNEGHKKTPSKTYDLPLGSFLSQKVDEALGSDQRTDLQKYWASRAHLVTEGKAARACNQDLIEYRQSIREESNANAMRKKRIADRIRQKRGDHSAF